MTDRRFGVLLLLPAAVLLLGLAAFPVLQSFWLSFHRVLLTMPGMGETFVGLENFRRLASDPGARDSLGFTFIFVFGTTACEILLGLAMALTLNRSFKGRGWVRAAILIPWAVPTVVASQMWRFIFNDQYGLANLLIFGSQAQSYQAWLADPWSARAAIMAADIWKTSSFAALLILAGLQTIPDELYEAARVDGANPWAQFWRITLPLLKPALLVAILFRTMDAFRVFDLVFVMTQGGPGNRTSVLQFFGYKRMFTEGDLGYGAAVSVVVFLIIFVISMFYVRMVGTRLFEKAEA